MPGRAGSALILALAWLGIGCGSETPGTTGIQSPEPEANPVALVLVTAPDTVIEVGDSLQLAAAAFDSAGTRLEGRTFAWASDDGSIATVSETGLVTTISEGSVVISATVEGVRGGLGLTVGPAPPDGPVTIGLEEVAAGLGFPLYLTTPPNDPRLFIVEKGGTIRIVKDGALLPTPFLDLSARVSTKPEQGLLGLAFPPDYATSGRLVVHYTDLEDDTRVSTFRVSDDPDRADPSGESIVLTVGQPGPAHNGGQILFGPDGDLYIALGDGGSRDGNDRGRGQSLDDLLGSILRIDLAGGAPYAIPPDNPFVGTGGARGEIWSYGLRNPWRFSFDRMTGDVYIADVGDHRWEEVNRARASESAGRGLNFGWSVMEGRHCMQDGCDQTGLTPPLLEYDHDQGCAVTGGYVYRGSAIPGLQGQYFFADFCGGWVHSITADGDGADQVDWPTLRPGAGIPSFGEDAAGELYVLSSDGRVFRIVPR